MSTYQDLPEALQKRSRKDFEFLVVCQSKGNYGMYELLKDASLQDDIKAFRESQQQG